MYNQTVRLELDGIGQQEIADRLVSETDLVKNTAQRVVSKAFETVENSRRHDEVGAPSDTKTGPYPLRANYEEGFTLETQDDGRVGFRISVRPYEHVTGVLAGSDAHLDTLRTALRGDRWEIGTAEAVFKSGIPELHIAITDPQQSVRVKQNSRTVIGVDVNEDNVALTAVSADGISDSVILEFPRIKYERHRYFTIRKRAQSANKSSIHDTLRGRERRFVRDQMHKVSRRIVEWCQQFERPCIVFEDLKDLQAQRDYGTRMNRRLHHLPFRTLQFYTSYKATFESIPTARVNSEYTSQQCALTECEFTSRNNRNKNRFKCRECGHQDHADRNASLNVAKRGVAGVNWNVPALNNLPQVNKVRWQASGAVDAPTVTHDTGQGDQTDGVSGVST